MKDCINFMGKLNKGGYGVVRINRKYLMAHRVSYQLFNGAIPDGFQVCHKCDNPSCINVSHLFVGTLLDNYQDMVNKGRAWWQNPKKRTKISHVIKKTKNRHLFKLTKEQVLGIRDKYSKGIRQRALAKEYGLSLACIWKIVNRKMWMDF